MGSRHCHMVFGSIILFNIVVPCLDYGTYMKKTEDILGTGKHCKLSFVKTFILLEGINILLVLWRWWKGPYWMTSCGMKGTHMFIPCIRNCFIYKFLVIIQNCFSIVEILTKMILIQIGSSKIKEIKQ